MKNLFFLLLALLCLASCGNRVEERVEKTYPGGQPHYVRYYEKTKDGESCIREVEYYENGVVKMEGSLSDGHRDGEWKAYFPDGRPQSIGAFKDGLREGASQVYYDNGNLLMEGTYSKGKRVGVWCEYNEMGIKIREADYGE